MANRVDQGLLSRAASQLSSRGLAPCNSATVQKVEALFPIGQLPLKNALYEPPAFELQPTDVKKAVIKSPKGLAAGCSGLRAEHMKTVLQDRNIGRAGQALDALTKLVNLCVGGHLPPKLLCGGRLIPLNKRTPVFAQSWANFYVALRPSSL